MSTKEIKQLLNTLGIPSGPAGYKPLVHLIELAMQYCDSPKLPLLKELCRETAQLYDTTTSKVEDNAQTLITNYWDNHSYEDFQKVTGFQTSYRLALKDFIFVLANYLFMQES